MLLPQPPPVLVAQPPQALDLVPRGAEGDQPAAAALLAGPGPDYPGALAGVCGPLGSRTPAAFGEEETYSRSLQPLRRSQALCTVFHRLPFGATHGIVLAGL